MNASVVLLIGAALVGQVKETDPKVIFEEFKKAGYEQKLAILEHGEIVPARDKRLEPFQDLLDGLKTAYKQTPEEIADLTIVAVIRLRQEGRRVYPREILEMFSFFDNADRRELEIKRDYALDLKAYLMFRTAGHPHTVGAMLFVDYLRLGHDLGVDTTGNTPSKKSSAPAPLPPPKKPESNPRALTTLNMGHGLIKAKKPEAARKYYQDVIDKYPETIEAGTAKEKLEAMDKAGYRDAK